MRRSRLLALLAGAVLAAAPVRADAPRRVVSTNVCTDQLAMMLAAPGQLVSVSTLAADPRTSAMPDEAAEYLPNSGRAEEVFLMDPDLVLAGAYTRREATQMLRRLGIEVEVFEPAAGLADIPDRLARMGAALGREAEASALIAEFEANLAALAAPEGPRPRAVIYNPNGYTTGDRTLAGQILEAGGFENLASEAGIPGGGILPLELLVMLQPDLVIGGEPWPGASRSEEIVRHPAIPRAAGRTAPRIADRDWICGTPHVVNAVAELADLRAEMNDR